MLVSVWLLGLAAVICVLHVGQSIRQAVLLAAQAQHEDAERARESLYQARLTLESIERALKSGRY